MKKAENIQKVKDAFPAGTRIILIEMPDDPQPIKPGSLGTVRGVDDFGQVLMSWDCGRSLSLVPGIDKFEKWEGGKNGEK